MGDEHATAASAASRSWDRSPSWLAPSERPDFRCRLLRQLRDRPISVGSSGSRLRCTYLWQGEPCTVACLLLFVVVIHGVKRSEISGLLRDTHIPSTSVQDLVPFSQTFVVCAFSCLCLVGADLSTQTCPLVHYTAVQHIFQYYVSARYCTYDTLLDLH